MKILEGGMAIIGIVLASLILGVWGAVIIAVPIMLIMAITKRK